MQRHGWVPLRTGWLVETPTPLTPDQIARARDAAADDGLTIEVRRTQDGVAEVRTIATIVGALTALAIVAMTIGLIRSESSRDLRTLTATGASPRTRRAITASTAGALALLGVVLGVAGAYVALIAAYHADLAQLVPPPTLNLIGLVVGLPLAAAAAGWVLAGREPAHVRPPSARLTSGRAALRHQDHDVGDDLTGVADVVADAELRPDGQRAGAHCVLPA